jgi:hypothetical protein
VLVIIGLSVGGCWWGKTSYVLPGNGRKLSQIEKYNAAVNTFRGKYNSLPGDLNQQVASTYGFAPRGNLISEGEGNGVLEGNSNNASGLYRKVKKEPGHKRDAQDEGHGDGQKRLRRHKEYPKPESENRVERTLRISTLGAETGSGKWNSCGAIVFG